MDVLWLKVIEDFFHRLLVVNQDTHQLYTGNRRHIGNLKRNMEYELRLRSIEQAHCHTENNRHIRNTGNAGNSRHAGNSRYTGTLAYTYLSAGRSSLEFLATCTSVVASVLTSLFLLASMEGCCLRACLTLMVLTSCRAWAMTGAGNRLSSAKRRPRE